MSATEDTQERAVDARVLERVAVPAARDVSLDDVMRHWGARAMLVVFKGLLLLLFAIGGYVAQKELEGINDAQRKLDVNQQQQNVLIAQLRDDVQTFRVGHDKFQEETTRRFIDIGERITDLVDTMAGLTARVDGLEKRIDASEREAELRRQVWMQSVEQYGQDARDWRRREAARAR